MTLIAVTRSFHLSLPPSQSQDNTLGHAPQRLKMHEDMRLCVGHVWVFSIEVDFTATPLTAFTPGQLVEFQDHTGKTIGNGCVNPHSLIVGWLVCCVFGFFFFLLLLFFC